MPRPTSAALLALLLPILLLVLLLGACAPTRTAWDGRRGYDGNGDYGYHPAGTLAAARAGQVLAARRAYVVPGPPSDPWGPHVREASRRFQVPERWIREVMQQESGGRLYGADGSPITSVAGAMGLMQVMPRTYEILRRRHGLGADPHEPRDNILAGTAYIRDMYDRYGAPGFLAAYNAGPDRVELVLAGATILPEETLNYLASVGPRLGPNVPMTGPLAEYVGGGGGAFAGGGMTGAEYDALARGGAMAGDDPSRRAFEGGGLVTPDAPTGRMGTLPRS